MNNLTRIRAIIYTLSIKACLAGKAMLWQSGYKPRAFGSYDRIAMKLRG